MRTLTRTVDSVRGSRSASLADDDSVDGQVVDAPRSLGRRRFPDLTARQPRDVQERQYGLPWSIKPPCANNL